MGRFRVRVRTRVTLLCDSIYPQALCYSITQGATAKEVVSVRVSVERYMYMLAGKGPRV